MSYLLTELFQENTLIIHIVPTGTYPVYKYANQTVHSAILESAIPRNCDPHPKSTKMRSEKYHSGIHKAPKWIQKVPKCGPQKY